MCYSVCAMRFNDKKREMMNSQQFYSKVQVHSSLPFSLYLLFTSHEAGPFCCQPISVQLILFITKERAGVQQVVIEESNSMKQRINSLELMISKLQSKNTTLSKENSQFRAGWLQSEARVKELSMDVEDLRSDLTTAHNR